MALAIRSLGSGEAQPAKPAAVLEIVERLMREGDARTGGVGADLCDDDALALLRGWLDAMALGIDEATLLRMLQDGRAQPRRPAAARARRIHERRLGKAVADVISSAQEGRLDILRHSRELFDACLPAIPYAASAAFLGREKLKLTRSDGDRPRVAIVADGLSSVHGVSHTITQIRERGVPGYEVEVIGTDADVDRRLSSVAEIEVPFYKGLQIGVPGLPAIVEALSDGRYDVVHLCSPGPAGVGAWLLARVLALPVVGSYHTELARYAGVRSGSDQLEIMAGAALGAFYGSCDVVLSPSPATDASLRSSSGSMSCRDPALGPRRRPDPVRSGDARRGPVRR